MSFWEMVSILRSEHSRLSVLLDDPKWWLYSGWFDDFEMHVREKNRSILDAAIPNELARAALLLCKSQFQIRDGRLDQLTSPTGMDSLTAIKVYDRSGATPIEDVFEYGTHRLSSIGSTD